MLSTTQFIIIAILLGIALLVRYIVQTPQLFPCKPHSCESLSTIINNQFVVKENELFYTVPTDVCFAVTNVTDTTLDLQYFNHTAKYTKASSLDRDVYFQYKNAYYTPTDANLLRYSNACNLRHFLTIFMF